MFRSLPMPVLFTILALALLLFGPRLGGPWNRGSDGSRGHVRRSAKRRPPS